MTPTSASRTTKFSGELRAACGAEWRAAHEDHPFVRAMGDGTLSLERFQFFMQQDYLFLIDYCRVLGWAVAKSPRLEEMGKWAKLLDETLNSEMALHRSFCADFGITAGELESTVPAPATVAYVMHLTRTANDGQIGVIASSLLPCQWGYDEIGRTLSASLRVLRGSFHARWVEGYCSPEYRAVTEWLRGYVDQIGASGTPEVRRRMEGVFRESVAHEKAFWDQAWRAG